MDFYQILKGLHNIIRWVVVLGGIYAIVTSLQGLFNNGKWTDTNKRAGLIFTNALNLQFVIGLILFFISPYIKGLLASGMSNIMSNSQSRFFVVEHWFTMILALVAAQLGYSLAKRANTDRAKFTRSSIGYVLAALLMAYGIPWGRPLFPF
jgi:ABC-type dipeptide/oligopeptide/nickel transport system permease component